MVPPNHPIFNRVFHYFHHPFWGKHPYFRKHPYCSLGVYFAEPWVFSQQRQFSTGFHWGLVAELLGDGGKFQHLKSQGGSRSIYFIFCFFCIYIYIRRIYIYISIKDYISVYIYIYIYDYIYFCLYIYIYSRASLICIALMRQGDALLFPATVFAFCMEKPARKESCSRATQVTIWQMGVSKNRETGPKNGWWK